MLKENYIGWDIGGAHLKMSHVDHKGEVISVCQLATPLWEGLDRLSAALEQSCKYLPEKKLKHAITTTAELVDIFPNRKAGITCITEILRDFLSEDELFFYAGDIGFVPFLQSEQYTQNIASANWHATASFLTHHVDNGILIDIGSTTTDIIPVKSGGLCNHAYSDFDRMRCNELVYTGVIRTPVMAIVNRVPFNGKWQPLAAENFATIADVYRLTGEISEKEDMHLSSDGKGKTLIESARRLGRMLGIDINTNEPLQPWYQIAQYIAEKHLEHIQGALNKILKRKEISNSSVIVGAGCGGFLARKIAENCNLQYMDFSDMLIMKKGYKVDTTRCATAIAIAQILRRNLQI